VTLPHDEQRAIRHSGRRIASAFNAWRRSSSLAATWWVVRLCVAMNCTNWLATRHRATVSAFWDGAAKRLIALTGTLMGGYADDLFNIFYRMEPRTMASEGFAYGGQDGATFSTYGVLETIERCGIRTTPAHGRRRRRSRF